MISSGLTPKAAARRRRPPATLLTISAWSGPRVAEQHGLIGGLDNLAHIGEGDGLIVDFHFIHLDKLLNEAAQPKFVEIDLRLRAVAAFRPRFG